MMLRRQMCAATVALISCASTLSAKTRDNVKSTGVSGIWLLANFCYAGMRAQNHPSALWRTVAFLFGFPGTLITLLVVTEGAERVYGVDIPKRQE